MRNLTTIANKYSCDKGTEHYEKHGYTKVYKDYIPQEGEYDLLEIGIWHGDSLKMWNEYNPDIQIDGIDIDVSVFNFIQETDKIKIHIGNQSDIEFLKSITKNKEYDFIIDDGSHNYEDIITSFKYLYTKLKSRGYYFIEDLHAGQANINKIIIDINSFKYIKEINLVCNNKLLIIQKI